MQKTKKFDVVTAHSYGDGKTMWHKIGVAFPGRGKSEMNIKLHSLPIPNDDGEIWLNLFESEEYTPRKREEDKRTPAEATGDEVPF
jgi:hypothetical protein